MMPGTLHEAVRCLVDVLERENAALAAMDLPRAVALLEEKTAALAALTAVGEGASVPAECAPAARRVDALAQENRRLLERAIAAQQRVIGIVAGAVASAVSEPVYGPGGRRTRPGSPMALSTRA